MAEKVRIGIFTCARYKNCAGGKCFRALYNREGAFSRYKGKEVELVGYANCGGCPGVNIEYTPAEMLINKVDVIHLATCLVVGYPPCPRINSFEDFIKAKYGVDVVIGTHPIPKKYYETHQKLKTWSSNRWQINIADILTDEETRARYD